MSITTEYRTLLAKFLPQPIRTDDDYRRVLGQLEQLMVPQPSGARRLLIEVLATLVEMYESRDYPTPEVDPPEVLSHLLKSKGVKSADVAKETGIPAATMSNVLAHRRGISKSNAVKLGKYFGLSPMTFLSTPAGNRTATKQKSRLRKSSKIR